MLCPSHCPAEIYLLMLKCWSENPKDRPTFDDLSNKIEEIITKLKEKSRQFKVSLGIDYVNLPVEIQYYNDIDAIKQEIENQIQQTNKPNFYSVSSKTY